MIAGAERKLDQDTRIALSDVAISFIPVTEIVFDLGGAAPPAPPAPPKKGGKTPPAHATGAGLYRWHIYGFEKRLPKDWRFLNWDRVMLTVMVCALVIAIALLVLLLSRG
jgi:hypothetical protein